MTDNGLHIIVGSDGAAFATARAARERGYDALVLVPRGAPSVRVIPSDIHARDLDPREKGAFARAFKDASVVHYCGGPATLPIDDEEPARLAHIVEGVKHAGARFVYCDAPYAYGVPSRAITEDLPQRARDPLGLFLSSLAKFVIQNHRKGNVTAVIARHGDLFGPEIVRSEFSVEFVHRVLNNRPISILGKRSSPRTLTYSADLGRALVLLSEQEDAFGQVWHLPSTPAVSPEKLVDGIRAAAGAEPIARKTIHEIRSKGSLFASKRDKAQRKLARVYESRFALSSAKFERAFGMHATSLNDIVAETVEALKRA